MGGRCSDGARGGISSLALAVLAIQPLLRPCYGPMVASVGRQREKKERQRRDRPPDEYSKKQALIIKLATGPPDLFAVLFVVGQSN